MGQVLQHAGAYLFIYFFGLLFAPLFDVQISEGSFSKVLGGLRPSALS